VSTVNADRIPSPLRYCQYCKMDFNWEVNSRDGSLNCPSATLVSSVSFPYRGNVVSRPVVICKECAKNFSPRKLDKAIDDARVEWLTWYIAQESSDPCTREAWSGFVDKLVEPLVRDVLR
jgi:hypothetical protein